MFSRWAWEELNLRPHAYQGHPKRHCGPTAVDFQALALASAITRYCDLLLVLLLSDPSVIPSSCIR